MLYDAVPSESRQMLQDIIRATDYGFMSREDYYRDIGELASRTPNEIRELESRQHSRDERMIAYAQTFRSKYKVGLLSNIDSDTIRRLFPNAEELFDVFVISGDVGITKPSVEIFEIAAVKLGLRPEECLMIDDLPKNIDGAQMAGMQALLFTSQYDLERELPKMLEQYA